MTSVVVDVRVVSSVVVPFFVWGKAMEPNAIPMMSATNATAIIAEKLGLRSEVKVCYVRERETLCIQLSLMLLVLIFRTIR